VGAPKTCVHVLGFTVLNVGGSGSLTLAWESGIVQVRDGGSAVQRKRYVLPASVSQPPRLFGKTMTRVTARQAARFCIVGIVNTAIDIVVLNLLIFITGTGHTGPLFTAFKTISFGAALLNSFFMNSRWTFACESRGGRPTVSQGAQFVVVSVLSSLVNVASASYVASFMKPPAEFVAYWPTVAALVGTVFSFVFNFIGYKFLVFSNRASA
jgi:putative flippase GtrA